MVVAKFLARNGPSGWYSQPWMSRADQSLSRQKPAMCSAAPAIGDRWCPAHCPGRSRCRARARSRAGGTARTSGGAAESPAALRCPLGRRTVGAGGDVSTSCARDSQSARTCSLAAAGCRAGTACRRSSRDECRRRSRCSRRSSAGRCIVQSPAGSSFGSSACALWGAVGEQLEQPRAAAPVARPAPAAMNAVQRRLDGQFRGVRGLAGEQAILVRRLPRRGRSRQWRRRRGAGVARLA